MSWSLSRRGISLCIHLSVVLTKLWAEKYQGDAMETTGLQLDSFVLDPH